jgi:transposase
VPGPERCPYCGGPLDPKGSKARTIIEVDPVRKEVIRYQLEQRDCGRCHRTFTARPPGVFARGLFGNQLLTHLAVEHYVHGVTLGHLSAQLGVGQGSLWAALHQLGRRLATVPQRLLWEYRRAPVKHADETGWRNDGRNGYAWLFCTERISLFRFRASRSASVAQEVFGAKRLPGTLVVDRYNGYNRLPCAIQYCYAHLLREVQDLGKEFPAVGEVSRFVGSLAPLLADAMKLRAQQLTTAQFRQQALELKVEIKALVHAPAQHPGIQKIQNLFREKAPRLYHWAKSPTIPADNNRAERELRPLVIARKISFGSQSEQGAQTREILMTVLHTLRKRTNDVFGAFKRALDALAEDEKRDPYRLLFDSS